MNVVQIGVDGSEQDVQRHVADHRDHRDAEDEEVFRAANAKPWLRKVTDWTGVLSFVCFIAGGSIGIYSLLNGPGN